MAPDHRWADSERRLLERAAGSRRRARRAQVNLEVLRAIRPRWDPHVECICAVNGDLILRTPDVPGAFVQVHPDVGDQELTLVISLKRVGLGGSTEEKECRRTEADVVLDDVLTALIRPWNR